jgi:hypothetical protein
MHLDLTVADIASLAEQHGRALGLGATLLLDRSDDADEPLYVYADPAGHPFCFRLRRLNHRPALQAALRSL